MKINSNSVVIVTGASRGIGKEAALTFARRGAKVVLASRDETRMNQVAEEIRAMGREVLVVRCDVSRESDCKQAVLKTIERFGRVDVLVNNAGAGHYAAIEKLTTEALDHIFKTNLYGAIWCTQAVLPQMKKQKKGNIVNVSTIISKRAIPFLTAYCMTKFAMNAMDEGLRLEVRPFGINVSLVCPGLTATDFQMNAGRTDAQSTPLLSAGGMSAAAVGRAIVSAVEKNRRRVGLTLGGKFLWFFQKLSPWFMDEIMYLIYSRRMKRQDI